MMGSVGSERFKELSPAGTPEGNVVMSFSFDSYQLEEDELQRGSQAKGVLTFMEPGEGRHSREMGSLLHSHPFRSLLGWVEWPQMARNAQNGLNGLFLGPVCAHVKCIYLGKEFPHPGPVSLWGAALWM